MNVAVMLLHIDCPTISADCPTPPKLQLICDEAQMYGRCPACEGWVSLTIDAVDPPAFHTQIPVVAAAH